MPDEKMIDYSHSTNIETLREVPVTFAPSTQGKKIIREQMQGTCLPIWNAKELYDEIRPGLETVRYTLVRFPNGSLSNDYHWNGSGSYTADGMWECGSVEYKPGFMSQLKYRGTSKDHYGFSGASAITDGDTATMWKQSNGQEILCRTLGFFPDFIMTIFVWISSGYLGYNSHTILYASGADNGPQAYQRISLSPNKR